MESKSQDINSCPTIFTQLAFSITVNITLRMLLIKHKRFSLLTLFYTLLFPSLPSALRRQEYPFILVYTVVMLFPAFYCCGERCCCCSAPRVSDRTMQRVNQPASGRARQSENQQFCHKREGVLLRRVSEEE